MEKDKGYRGEGQNFKDREERVKILNQAGKHRESLCEEVLLEDMKELTTQI